MITLNLPIENINVVLTHLARGTWGDVSQTIDMIHEQAKPQHEANMAAEAAAAEAQASHDEPVAEAATEPAAN